jgi:hypothetical protein
MGMGYWITFVHPRPDRRHKNHKITAPEFIAFQAFYTGNDWMITFHSSNMNSSLVGEPLFITCAWCAGPACGRTGYADVYK